jgi:hypothetical protein
MNPDNGERYRRTKAARLAKLAEVDASICSVCGFNCGWQELDRMLKQAEALMDRAKVELSCACWNIARDGHQADCRLGVKVATGFTEPVTGTIPRYQVIMGDDGDGIQVEVSGAVYQDFDANNEPLGEPYD